MYHIAMQDTLDRVLGFCSSGDCSLSQVVMLRGLKRIQDMYGHIYDPDKEVFDVKEDEHGLLD